MDDKQPAHILDEERHKPPTYASFVLRCWTGDAGQIRARLIDLNSGVSYAVADLARLPGLVRHLTTGDLPEHQTAELPPEGREG